MEFLVLARPRGQAFAFDDPYGTYQAVKDYLDRGLESGWIASARSLIDGGAVLVVKASSAEELWDQLHSNPVFPAFEYEIEPLVQLDHTFRWVFEELSQQS